MREEGIRLFLQRLAKTKFDEDAVILELQDITSELQKVNLAIPPVTVHLLEIRELNREALRRVEEAEEEGKEERVSAHPHTGHLNGLVRPVAR